MKLFLPRDPVLQHVIGCDEHVIFIVFGNVAAVSFEEVLTGEQRDSFASVFYGMAIVIPYLSSSKEGQAQVSLQMAVYNNDSRHIIHSDVVLPLPVNADRLIHITNESNIQLIYEKDDLRLHLTGERAGTCLSTGDRGEEDVNEYEHELQLSQTGPDFSVCDLLPDLDIDFCRIYRDPRYRQPLSKAGYNVCQYWKQTKNVKNCKASFHVAYMSDEMRELLALDSVTQNPVESELRKGTFEVNVVFPCVE
ncbi:hypothetical protein HOLleu_05375 [Holothuria leucospilota]|uniref:Uncharacterized protein n=1 Tax=Holothuria leucospilota TaxID=206669 RepID=A0A9Q1CJU8_HOLLE|nr:hypothetical protein HOLleu_05375 [Holothuria leucospilota]